MDIRFFDVSFRTAFAQARELALAQSHIPLLTPGSVQVEQRGNGRFVYRYRYDAAGKRIAEYLGPEGDDETQARVAGAEAEIADAATLGQASLALRKIGFHSVDNSSLVTVAALFNAGIFGRGGILVGTNAFGAILNELGVVSTAIARTADVDVARLNRIEIAALPAGGFLKLLESTGLPFFPVPQLERGQPATSYKARGKPVLVDLLVPAKGEPYEPVLVPELGVHAVGLPHLRFLLEKITTSILLGRDRIVPVTIPDAGRYCIHKLIVHSLRSTQTKGAKDLEQAVMLAAILAEEHDYLLLDAIDALPQTARSKVKRGAGRAVAMLEAAHPRAADVLAALT